MVDYRPQNLMPERAPAHYALGFHPEYSSYPYSNFKHQFGFGIKKLCTVNICQMKNSILPLTCLYNRTCITDISFYKCKFSLNIPQTIYSSPVIIVKNRNGKTLLH